MNIKLLLILFAAIGGLSYGVLSNDMELSVQKFDFLSLPAMDEDPLADHASLGSFKCSCLGTDSETGEERFDPSFCNVEYDVEPTDDDPGIPAEGSLGLSGNKLCLWEVSSEESPIEEQTETQIFSGEGCSFRVWLEHSDPSSADYMWPPGYHPKYEYASIFQIEYDDDDRRGHDDSHDDSNDDSHDDSNDDSNDDSHDDSDDDKFTLLDALSGNSLKNKQELIAKQSVAAILNAAHSEINYHYSVPEVMSITHDAFLTYDYNQYSKEFKKYNESGGNSLCS